MNRPGDRPDDGKSAPFPRVLGRYHLIDELSENNVGVLYLARLEGPKGFQRWAAVRCVHPHLAADASYVQDFYEATRAAANIRHPNVEATLDVGETDGSLWVALEYLHGERVAHLVSRAEVAETGVAWDVACRIVAQAALGLEAVHASHNARGEPLALTHGRLTPRQIFVGYGGETKVLEACVPRRATSALSSDVLPYLSPEQIWGEATDKRSDVFALGVVLWEMCAGSRLFLGDDDDATRALLQKHKVPRLETKVRGLPARIDDVIETALAVEPARRYSSAQALARAIEEALVAESLVVTDYDAGRYMKALFADRFAAREERLRRAADTTEVFKRSSLPVSMSPAKAPAKRAPTAKSVPPPARPPERAKAPVPIPPPTVRDIDADATVEQIDAVRLEDSQESATQIMGPAERAMLVAEANPQEATTDESETAKSLGLLNQNATPNVNQNASRGLVNKGLDYDDDTGKTVERPIAPRVVKSAPPPRVLPKPAPIVAKSTPPPALPPMRSQPPPQVVQSRPPSAYETHPPKVEIHATPPPMRVADAIHVVNAARTASAPPASAPVMNAPHPANAANAPRAMTAPNAGYLRIPPTTHAAPSMVRTPIPPAAQTYMIEPRGARELSLVVRLVVLATAVAVIAVIYEVWSRPRATPIAQNSPEAVTPATASTPTGALAPTGIVPTATPTPTTFNPEDLPEATGVVLPTARAPHASNPPQVSHHKSAPPPPVVKPEPPTQPVAPPSAGSGFLTVICTPACDDVLDGSSSLGPSPVFKAPVHSGSHRITLKTSDPPATKVVTVSVPTDDTAVIKQAMGN